MRTSYCPLVGALLAVSLLTWPVVEAAANPMTLGVSAVAQVPESHHVQVSWGCVSEAVGSDVASNAGDFALSRDGASLDAAWLEPVSLSHNTGSGLESVWVVQVCDCDVPLGEHTYDVTVPDEMGECGWGNLRVTVKDPPPATPEAWEQPNPDDYEYPWEIPSKPWPKGHDCLAWCASSRTSSLLTNDELSGCAAGGGGATSALLPLFLLALGVGRARRRNASR